MFQTIVSTASNAFIGTEYETRMYVTCVVYFSLVLCVVIAAMFFSKGGSPRKLKASDIRIDNWYFSRKRFVTAVSIMAAILIAVAAGILVISLQ